MARFSIIVPVYNVEDYLRNCLDSILNQSYEDYEVIVVNDGTKDNSQDIIDEYVKKDNRVKGYKKKNGGLSDARNFGVGKAKGDYLLFLDSDDSINNLLLEELNKEIEKNHPEMIRFQVVKVGKDKEEDKSALFENKTGPEAFRLLANNDYFVTAWSCVYERDFWMKNKFEYTLGVYHEDYGLTPYVYMKAKKLSSIDYVGYNYYVRDNSIINDKNIEKEKKKNSDVLKLFDLNMDVIDKDKNVDLVDKAYFRSYMANGLITKWKVQEGELFTEFYKEIKKRGLYMYLLDDTLPRKIKKILFRLVTKYYIKIFK